MKVALITGCSSGFGLELAKILSKNYIIFATFRKVEDSKDLEQYSSNIRPIILDIAKKETILSAITKIKYEYGRLDILINNAGIALQSSVLDGNEEDERKIFEVNYFGVVNLTRAAIPLLIESKGYIINIASLLGRFAVPSSSCYCATKFAVRAFSESLFHELNPLGVKVSVVNPGFSKTNIKDSAKIISPKNSQFYSLNNFMYKAASFLSDKGIKPIKIAKLIAKIIQKPQPKLIYNVGLDAKLLPILTKIIPARWINKIIIVLLSS